MKLLTQCALATLVAVPALAHAQIPEVQPDGTLSDPAASPSPEPQQPSGPVVIPLGPDGRPLPEAEGTDDDIGLYYRDDTAAYGDPDSGEPIYIGGPVPESHVVRRGDTLWDITWFYFNNPFDWPKVWSFNPEITNPHWIYPGDQVRLYAAGEAPVSTGGALGQPDTGGQPDTTGGSGTGGDRPRTGAFTIRQLAFVDQDKLKFAARVDGSTEEKLLLSSGDSVYLTYPSDRPPKVGKRYAIYEQRKAVTGADGKKQVGAYVKVIGELEVVSVKKGKKARAIITDSTDVIERGALVGPLQRQFKNVEPTEPVVDLQGTIVAQLFADVLIGARQVVIIDKGANQKVKRGNRMYVVRRGDAYVDLGGSPTSTGQDDRRFPARAIGEVIVVQVGVDTSLALVTISTQEIGVGDLVLMRKGSSDE
jgi:hypothetical protein